jgi:sec-independent protein translocase protein TatC
MYAPHQEKKLQTVSEHIDELRRRIFSTLLVFFLVAAVGYILRDGLLAILSSPLGEKLYVTSPAGAFNFVIKLCAAFGLIISLPVVTFHILRFLQPVMPIRIVKNFAKYLVASFLLTVCGVMFSYFVSLPAALKFLMNFGENRLELIITANEYFNFVLAYVLGFALLFQLPLIIMIINSVKPLPPRKMLSQLRFVIVGAAIVSAIITPTPDPVNQAIMAGPIILLYLVSVLAVVFANRSGKTVNLKPLPSKMIITDDLLSIEFEAVPLSPTVVSETVASRPRKFVIQDIVRPAQASS